MYIHYRKPMEHFILKLTGSRNQTEDLIQEVFLSLWEQRGKIDPNKNIGGYIYRMTRNIVLKNIYSKSVRLEKNCSESFVQNVIDDKEASDELQANELQLFIEIAVCRLPRQRREVFELYRKGYTHEEIARELQITVANAKQHLSLARKDLRNVIPVLALLFFLN